MPRLKLDYGVHQSEVRAFVEQDDLIQKFLARYKDRTYEGYSRALALFFNWLKVERNITISPTEMLNEQLKKSKKNTVGERRWAANLALELISNQDFSAASDTHRRFQWTVVKEFFNFNEVPFCSARNPLGGKSGRRKHKPKPLTREDGKRILTALNQRDRVVALIMIQSGMGIGETLNRFNFMLDYIQARIRAGAERIKIEFSERKGNGFSYFTFISRDAIQELRKWLILRERWIQEKKLKLTPEAEKAIFICQTGQVLTPMKYERNFDARLYARKVKTAPFQITTHMLRKIFKTESSPPERNISEKVVEFMMGHVEGLEAVGGTYDASPQIYEKAIEREYQKLEPWVNLFSGKATEQTEGSEEIEQLKARLDKIERNAALAQVIETLADQEDKREILEKFVSSLLPKTDSEKPRSEN